MDHLHRVARRTHTSERALGDTKVHVADAAGKRPKLLKNERAQRAHLAAPPHLLLRLVAYVNAGRIRPDHANSVLQRDVDRRETTPVPGWRWCRHWGRLSKRAKTANNLSSNAR